MGVEWPDMGPQRVFFQVDSHLDIAIDNYWRSLSSNQRFDYTEDMFAFKLRYEHGVNLRKVSGAHQNVHWIVENEDSEEATMFKLEWE